MPGFGSLHGMDLIVVLVVALLIFGPKRLPEMGSAVGKTFKEFKKSINEITEHKPESTPVERQIAATPVAAQATTETAPAAMTETVAQ
jgi:sec-independent protein translocase protein TatA